MRRDNKSHFSLELNPKLQETDNERYHFLLKKIHPVKNQLD